MILCLIASLVSVALSTNSSDWKYPTSLASCFFFGFGIMLFSEPQKRTTKSSDGRGWTQQENLFGKN